MSFGIGIGFTEFDAENFGCFCFLANRCVGWRLGWRRDTQVRQNQSGLLLLLLCERTAAHAALGQPEKAHAIIAEALASHLDLTSAVVDTCRDPNTRKTLVELLEGAGLPAGSATAAVA